MQKLKIKQIGHVRRTRAYKNPSAYRLYLTDALAPCCVTGRGGQLSAHWLMLMRTFLTPVRTEEGRRLRRIYGDTEGFRHRHLVPRTDGCSNTLTTVLKDNLIMGLEQQLATLEYHEHPTDAQLVEFFKPMAYIRKATPREYFRLMGLTDADIDKIDAYPCASVEEFAKADKAVRRQGISKCNKYKLAGNSIVTSVLYAIFEKMFIADCKAAPQQMTLDL